MANITIEKVVAFTLLVLIFSWDFHFLWLLYDILALSSIYFFIKHVNFKLGFSLLLSISFFLVLTVLSGFHIISFFSIWDNIKHLFVLFMLFFIIERHIEGRMLKFTEGFGFLVGGIFILQSILVFYQAFAGYFKDDISGTFGTASGHTFAYYCLLYIAYLFYVKRNYTLTFFVCILSLIMNYLAENMGFYPLVLVLLIYPWMSIKRFKYFILYFIIFGIVVALLDIVLGGILIQPVVYRFSEFFLVGSIDLDEFNLGRGYMTALAIHLGGWLGVGPGSHSDIYAFVGWEVIERVKINISTVTNLLVEYGIIGLFVWISLYLIFIKRFFRRRKDFLFVSAILLSSMLYNKVLNDERVISLLIFTMLFIKVHMHKAYKND